MKKQLERHILSDYKIDNSKLSNLSFKNIEIYLLSLDSNHPKVGRNIIAFDKKGNQIWEIEPDISDNGVEWKYLQIYKEGDLLKVQSFGGSEFIIEPKTGKKLSASSYR